MARSVGDANFSARELRLRAQNEALKAQIKGLQAKHKADLKVKSARIAELKARKSGS